MNYNNAHIFESLTEEQKLLIILSKASPDPSDLECIETLDFKSVDWTYIINFSKVHGITSLICFNINKHKNISVPELELKKLKTASLQNSKKNLFLTSVLLKILKDLKKIGIEAVAHKGPVLSRMLYDDITIRDFTDIDIIVYKKDVIKAKEYLIQNGYSPQFDLKGYKEDYYLNSKYYYINFLRDDSKAALDLHWALSAPNYGFSTGLEHFSSKLDKINLNNVSLDVLREEDLFLQLCIHGAKHNFSRFCWLADIVNLAAVNKGMDYEYITRQAAKLGCTNIVTFSAELIWCLFNVRLHVCHDLKPEQKTLLFAKNLVVNNTGHSAGSLFPDLFDSAKDRIIYYLNTYIYPTPIEFSVVNLNKYLFFVYYIIRLIRMFYKGIAKLLN